MALRHYVVTNRLVKEVKVEKQKDQFWYHFDENHISDTATAHMRCGRYVDRQGTVDSPWFFAPEGEDDDYKFPGDKPGDDHVKPKGGSKAMFDTLFDELERMNKDLLVFNFGYENRQEKEYGHLTHLHKKYISVPGGKLGRVLMITWPSQGFGEYNKELGRQGLLKKWWNSLFGPKQPETDGKKLRNDVQITGEALAIFLLKLNNYRKERYKNAAASVYRPKMHFIVQSMANSILEHCFTKLDAYGRHAEVTEMFSRLMLTSPDVRYDLMEISPAYNKATSLATKTYVVCSEQDLVLKVADIFHNIPGTKRMGLSGPMNMSKVPPNVHKLLVKQSKSSLSPIDFNHRYFEYNDAVVNRYLHIFNDGHTEREEELGA